MRRTQGVCILCRDIGQFALNSSIVRRAASSRSRHDTFNASKLVLDLDAADSKYVRRYEDQKIEDTEIKTQQWRISNSRQKAKKRKGTAGPERQKIVPDTFRATDADYLAFALLGDPFEKPSPFSSGLRAVLSKNEVSTRIGSFKHQLSWLKANADHPNIPNSPDAISSSHRHELYSYMLLDCQNFQHLSRATTFITQSRPGCEWISANGNVVVEAIKRFRRSQDMAISGSIIGAGQILKYINALVQKLEMQNLDPGAALCQAGMHYAAKRDIYSAVKKYVDMAADKGYEFNKHREVALATLTRKYLRNQLQQAEFQQSGHGIEGRKANLLRLLTGWNTDGRPNEGEERQPCFASLIGGKVSMYCTYITGLGQIGAHKALWFELMNPQPMPANQNHDAMTAEARADLFFNSFITASDTSVARATMKGSVDKELEDIIGLTSTTRLINVTTTPPRQLKDRKELVEYFQSRLTQLQEDLIKDDMNEHQAALLVLERLLVQEGKIQGKELQPEG